MKAAASRPFLSLTLVRIIMRFLVNMCLHSVCLRAGLKCNRVSGSGFNVGVREAVPASQKLLCEPNSIL